MSLPSLTMSMRHPHSSTQNSFTFPTSSVSSPNSPSGSSSPSASSSNTRVDASKDLLNGKDKERAKSATLEKKSHTDILHPLAYSRSLRSTRSPSPFTTPVEESIAETSQEDESKSGKSSPTKRSMSAHQIRSPPTSSQTTRPAQQSHPHTQQYPNQQSSQPQKQPQQEQQQPSPQHQPQQQQQVPPPPPPPPLVSSTPLATPSSIFPRHLTNQGAPPPGGGTPERREDLAVLLGIHNWPHSDDSLRQALSLRMEQERTKQEYYRLELLRSSQELLHRALSANIPPESIPTLFTTLHDQASANSATGFQAAQNTSRPFPPPPPPPSLPSSGQRHQAAPPTAAPFAPHAPPPMAPPLQMQSSSTAPPPPQTLHSQPPPPSRSVVPQQQQQQTQVSAASAAAAAAGSYAANWPAMAKKNDSRFQHSRNYSLPQGAMGEGFQQPPPVMPQQQPSKPPAMAFRPGHQHTASTSAIPTQTFASPTKNPAGAQWQAFSSTSQFPAPSSSSNSTQSLQHIYQFHHYNPNQPKGSHVKKNSAGSGGEDEPMLKRQKSVNERESRQSVAAASSALHSNLRRRGNHSRHRSEASIPARGTEFRPWQSPTIQATQPLPSNSREQPRRNDDVDMEGGVQVLANAAVEESEKAEQNSRATTSHERAQKHGVDFITEPKAK